MILRKKKRKEKKSSLKLNVNTWDRVMQMFSFLKECASSTSQGENAQLRTWNSVARILKPPTDRKNLEPKKQNTDLLRNSRMWDTVCTLYIGVEC